MICGKLRENKLIIWQDAKISIGFEIHAQKLMHIYKNVISHLRFFKQLKFWQNPLRQILQTLTDIIKKEKLLDTGVCKATEKKQRDGNHNLSGETVDATTIQIRQGVCDVAWWVNCAKCLTMCHTIWRRDVFFLFFPAHDACRCSELADIQWGLNLFMVGTCSHTDQGVPGLICGPYPKVCLGLLAIIITPDFLNAIKELCSHSTAYISDKQTPELTLLWRTEWVVSGATLVNATGLQAVYLTKPCLA